MKLNYPGQLLFLTMMLVATLNGAAQDNFPSLYNKAKEAYKAKANSEFQTLIQKALLLNPRHQGALYYAGIASCLEGKPYEAVKYLEKSIAIDSRYPISTNPDLLVLHSREDFRNLLQFQSASNTPIISSDTAFVIPDRQLHAEGIAYDSKTNTFFLGSIHKRKIIKIDADGTVKDFSPNPIQGMASIFGLKVDAKKRLLWACSSAVPETNSYHASMRSAVFKFNIDSNSLLETYEPDSTIKGAIFGDLILSPTGDVFVSDSKNNIIFKLNESSKRLEIYYTSSEFRNIQGLTFSDDGQFLYVADYLEGIFILPIETKLLIKLRELPLTSLKGIDGLLIYNNSLLAIQNGVFPLRVVRYQLNEQGTSIQAAHPIDSHHPAFNEPTLGTIVGDKLYYIANSQWSGYDDRHMIKPADQLQDIVILKCNLANLPK